MSTQANNNDSKHIVEILKQLTETAAQNRCTFKIVLDFYTIDAYNEFVSVVTKAIRIAYNKSALAYAAIHIDAYGNSVFLDTNDADEFSANHTLNASSLVEDGNKLLMSLNKDIDNVVLSPVDVVNALNEYVSKRINILLTNEQEAKIVKFIEDNLGSELNLETVHTCNIYVLTIKERINNLHQQFLQLADLAKRENVKTAVILNSVTMSSADVCVALNRAEDDLDYKTTQMSSLCNSAALLIANSKFELCDTILEAKKKANNVKTLAELIKRS